MKRNQILILLAMLILYAVCAFFSYMMMANQANTANQFTGMSAAWIGLINAAIVLVAYGLIALGGYWLSGKINLPGIFSPEGGWKRWVVIPMFIGLGGGLFLVVGDLLFAQINGVGKFPHPAFPLSILSAITAGIGEEILFRGFVLVLFTFIFNWIFKRLEKPLAPFWIANILAALIFAAGHLPTAMYLTGATSITQLNPIMLLEIFVLNGAIGVLAGERYKEDGLVAAAGVHFWADMVFHVLWGLVP
jgi:membrane protease YdiL (CAAX protease family)